MVLLRGSFWSASSAPAGRSRPGWQARAGGGALIGPKLFPLLSAAGLSAVSVSPLTVRERAIALGLGDSCGWEQAIEEPRRTTEGAVRI